jgi:hypothetical protein
MSITATMATNRSFILPLSCRARSLLNHRDCPVFHALFCHGFIFDSTATYAIVWWSGVWLAIAAGLIVLPLSDRREAAPA